jgi:hypothetical protein
MFWALPGPGRVSAFYRHGNIPFILPQVELILNLHYICYYICMEFLAVIT